MVERHDPAPIPKLPRSWALAMHSFLIAGCVRLASDAGNDEILLKQMSLAPPLTYSDGQLQEFR